MAKLIQAFATLCPRIDLGEAAEPKRFMELITQRTTLSSGVVKNVQESEVETLIGLLKEGRPVHTGVAIFTPSVDLEGNLNVNVRVDKRILSALNASGAFTGAIHNNENIGKTKQQIAALWNETHPDDLIVLETPPVPEPQP
jgi:predicted metal-dependent enzyme (double-stranded beta helix superfamily)